MAGKRKSKELVNFIKEQSLPQDELKAAFEHETEHLAVSRFRFCLAILLLFFGFTFLAEYASSAAAIWAPSMRVRLICSGVFAFFALLSLVPQFRRSCYAFTIMLAIFVGSFTTLLYVHGAATITDQMAVYTLFFIITGFLMPWGGLATTGICLPLFLFFPVSMFLGESISGVSATSVWRSSFYLLFYVFVAVLASRMNAAMRFKEFVLKKKLEDENRILQDYQVRLQRAYERVENLAVMDTLTGAYNRSYMTRWFSSEVYNDKDCKEVFSVIMFDVDGFKTINDMAGHQKGDRILQQVTRKINETLTGRSLIFRYGGDEFCIVLPGRTLKTGVYAAEEIRTRIERDPNLFVTLSGEQSLHVTMSIGVTCESAATSFDSSFLIKWVDTALLESKKKGRNCIHVFDPVERKILPGSAFLPGKQD